MQKCSKNKQKKVVNQGKKQVDAFEILRTSQKQTIKSIEEMFTKDQDQQNNKIKKEFKLNEDNRRANWLKKWFWNK